MNTQKIHTFAFVGGEGSGKSSGLAHVGMKLSDLGYQIFTIPEIATEFFENGITFRDGQITPIEFQQLVLAEQLHKEDLRKKVAEMSRIKKPIVILTDRAALDGMAYIGKPEFRKMAREMGFSLIELQARYDAVFHLVTAAEGAEAFYNNKTNRQRIQNAREAREMDQRLRTGYSIAREHYHIIDNSTGFRAKLNRLFKAVCFELGLPQPLEIERKYLVKPFSLKLLPAGTECTNIEQWYLWYMSSPCAREVRIRKRGHGGVPLYYFTEKRHVGAGIRIETTRQISEREYQNLIEERGDPTRYLIKKRYTFIWKYQFFELDVFVSPRRPFFLLEIELTNLAKRVALPDFIPVMEEVTGDEQYSNAYLATH